MIGILDYGMGNISSVYNALTHLGHTGMIVKSVEEITPCTHLIIPGVGSYAEAMKNIRLRKIDAAILSHAEHGKPLLGICLGMQLLSEQGEEGGSTMGLGLVGGVVKPLDIEELSIPHVGWNSLEFNFDHPICKNLKKHVDFYFVHSYFFNAVHDHQILANTHYGSRFPAIVVHKNVIGTQFHPEKSQDNGLLLIDNFCDWDGGC